MEKVTADERRGLLILTENLKSLSSLSRDDIGDIMVALIAYVLDREVNETAMSPVARAIYPLLRQQVDDVNEELRYWE